MKNLKKVITLILAFIMLTNIALFSIYAETTEAQKLNGLGLLSNITNNELDAILTRDIGVTMILKSLGYTDKDAIAAATSSPFTDVTDWAKGWVALANQLGITAGKSNTIFAPKDIMTEKEFVTFQLRALGYGTIETWENTIVLARNNQLISNTNNLTSNKYTKRDASIVMFNALSALLKDDDITLIEKLIDKKVVLPEEATTYNLIDSDFMVKNIVADNLKVITIYFTDDINEFSLTGETVVVKKNNVDVIYDNNSTNGVNAYQYGMEIVNKRTVRVIFGNANNQNDVISLNISGILSSSHDTIGSYQNTIKISDVQSPYIVDIKAINPKTVTVTFSEPIQYKIGSRIFDNVFINNQKITGTASLSVDQSVLTYTLNTKLSAGSYSFKTESVLDYAGLACNSQTSTISVVDDLIAPLIVAGEAINRNYVFLYFNELINTSQGEITVEGTSYALNNAARVKVEGKKVTIELSTPLAASNAFANIAVSYSNIEDLIGNKVPTTPKATFGFKAEFDEHVPTVFASVGTSNEILVSFSEPIQSFTAGNFVLQNKDGNTVATSLVAPIGSTSMLYKIILADALIDQTTYTITIKGVRDQSVLQNPVAETKINLLMKDKKQPEVVGVKLMPGEIIRIVFTEPMASSLLTNTSYYVYYDTSEGKTWPLATLSNVSITPSSDLKSVDIKIPGVVATDKITIGNIQDLSGVSLKDYNNAIIIQAPATFLVNSVTAKLIDARTIEIKATGHNFTSANPNDFKLKDVLGDSLYHYVQEAIINSTDSSILTLKLNADLNSDGTYLNRQQFIYVPSSTYTMDYYGEKLLILFNNPLVIQDSVKPTVSVTSDVATQIKVKFSEVVSTASNTEITNDVILRDETGTIVNLVIGGNAILTGGTNTFNNFDTITISGLTSEKTYTVEVVSRFIKDASSNILSANNSTLLIVK